MKSFKLSNIPVLLLLFISCTASLLMGCSGGGGGGGDGDGEPVDRLGPEALAAGMVFNFSGDYRNRSDTVTWFGSVQKTLTINSPTSGSWVDTSNWTPGSGDSGLTYTRGSTGNSARLVATTYRFASSTGQVGTVSITLSFTTETGGTFKEQGITDSGYTAEGTFTFDDASVPVTSAAP